MTTQNNVLKVTGSDGKVMYINTTTDKIIAKSGDSQYIVIAGQSYVCPEQ